MKELIIKVDEEKMDIEGNAPVIDKPQELVRCKDCKYYDTQNCDEGFGWCTRNGIGHGSNDAWFCADGKRRDEDGQEFFTSAGGAAE